MCKTFIWFVNNKGWEIFLHLNIIRPDLFGKKIQTIARLAKKQEKSSGPLWTKCQSKPGQIFTRLFLLKRSQFIPLWVTFLKTFSLTAEWKAADGKPNLSVVSICRSKNKYRLPIQEQNDDPILMPAGDPASSLPTNSNLGTFLNYNCADAEPINLCSFTSSYASCQHYSHKEEALDLQDAMHHAWWVERVAVPYSKSWHELGRHRRVRNGHEIESELTLADSEHFTQRFFFLNVKIR